VHALFKRIVHSRQIELREVRRLERLNLPALTGQILAARLLVSVIPAAARLLAFTM